MKQFKVDYSFIITILLVFFSPYQKSIFPFVLSLLIHELGHIFFVLLFKIKIKCLKLSALGFYLDVDTNNLKFKNEFLLYFGGILFNLISLLFFKEEYKNMAIMIILFNIIPIYPLDGFRMLKTIIAYIFNYKLTLFITNMISMITIVILFVYMISNIDYLLVFNLAYLFILSIIEIKNIKYTYHSFMLYKYLNKPKLKKRKISMSHNLINKLFKFHTIYTSIDKRIISEDEILELHYKGF